MPSDPHASVTRPSYPPAPLPPDTHPSGEFSSSPSVFSDPSFSSSFNSPSPSTSASSLASAAPFSPSPSSVAGGPPSSPRRLSVRPSPLVLKSNHNPRGTFSPRTSSLSSISRISTVTATVVGIRNSSASIVSTASTVNAASDGRQSLQASTSSASLPQQQQQPPPPPPPPSIRRKPLAPGNRSRSSSRSTTATSATTSSAATATVDAPQWEQQPPPLAVEAAFDVLYEDVLAASGDNSSLTTPDQRFTRPGSVDSPTLYEFPGDSNRAASASILSVLEGVDQRPLAGLDTTAGASGRNSLRATTPATSQTPTTTTVSQRAHDLTTSPTLDLYAAYDTESETEQAQEVRDSPDRNSPLSARSSAMSQFSRKTSPPHLQLGSLSNNKEPGGNKEEDSERRPSSDQDSLYSIYKETDTDKDPKTGTGNDAEDAFVLPVISTSSATSATTILTDGSTANSLLKPQPKSPGGSFKLGNLFGWSSASPASTDSDRGFSPLPSPAPSLQFPTTTTPAAHASSSQESYRTNKNDNKTVQNLATTQQTDTSLDYYENNLHTSPAHTHTTNTTTTARVLSPSSISPHSPSSASAHIEEMEDELKAISAELAASIRREMDLEDLVDRLQTEVGNGQQPSANRRTSDYFSDSGYNSTSGKAGDHDASALAARDEVAQIQRWAEQEKARVRLELTEKLSDERTRRRELDQQIQALSARAAELEQEHEHISSSNSKNSSDGDTSDRIRQLESTCEDLRRRLSEERNVKENFEDLLAAMKTELQSASNERDNLRDEVVPQLRARVEGLESQAAEHARNIYETTKAAQQQEMQINKGLPPPPPLSPSGLGPSLQQQQQQPPSAAPTTTGESRDALAERLKDVEAQRDALHQALKSLLERQEFQNRENDKRIRSLEQERLRLLAASPKKAGYERDVAALRDEVAVLRRRAEEALEHKWQVEKGLASLKMDLDRAEAEIAHLHMLLRQNDILVPESVAAAAATAAAGGALTSSRSLSDASDVSASSNGTLATTAATSVTSSSLIGAYRDLQATYAEALARIRELEAAASSSSLDNDDPAATAAALQRLEKALAATIAERDAAVAGVTDKAASAELANLDSERSLAGQLDASAERVEALATQVRAQLAANAQLRDRLAGLAARSGADQQTYKQRITGLEARLRTLEDELVASQTAADDSVARHEEQVAALREADSTQLLRLRDATGQLRALESGKSGRDGSGGSGSSSPRVLGMTAAANGGVVSTSAAAAAAAGLKSPLSPLFSVNGRLVPPAAGSRPSSRGSATSGLSASAEQMQMQQQQQQQQIQDQAAQIATLRARVGELEAALATAELEMQEVVGRMNGAQIEAMQLREEREEAARATRRLQRQLETEQVKTFEERFRQVSRAATTS